RRTACTTTRSPPTASKTASTTGRRRDSSTSSACSCRNLPGSTAEAKRDRRRLRRRLGGSAAPARGAGVLQLAAARPPAPARGRDWVDGAPDHALAHGD